MYKPRSKFHHLFDLNISYYRQCTKFGVKSMENSELHPSVESFKQFVKKNPKIIEAVRNEHVTWQELYEDWYLLGEEDPRWADFIAEEKESNKSPKKDHVDESAPTDEQKTDWIGQIVGAVKRMDAQTLEVHIQQLSQALTAIQGVLSQFQGTNQTKPVPKNSPPPHPFQFRKD